MFSNEPMRWALDAASAVPSQISALVGRMYVASFEQTADTSRMVLQLVGSCAYSPLVAELVGRGATTRIRRLDAACVQQSVPVPQNGDRRRP